MEIDKAINNLKYSKKHPTVRVRIYSKEIQLGIEALERLKNLREHTYFNYLGVLPSETEGGQ